MTRPPNIAPDQQQALFDAAATLAERQASTTGEGVAAAAMTTEGEVLTGVWVDAMVDAACLCAETGPICEAHRQGVALTASICVRWTPDGTTALAACGVCQERLAIFGREVFVGVADASASGYRFVPLSDLRPSPWWDVIPND